MNELVPPILLKDVPSFIYGVETPSKHHDIRIQVGAGANQNTLCSVSPKSRIKVLIDRPWPRRKKIPGKCSN